ncbi:hypothetical protein AB0M94_38755 [Streptomyces xanthochromogenes]|uniref:hypothetical protein n=1 Tax=Streptomyces xanthochromogenes TaxID=67384 RepID=UPI00344AF81B
MAFDDPRWEGRRPIGSGRRHADVSRVSRELAASVHEATKHKDNPEVLEQKLTAVIENLQRVSGVMRGGAIGSRGRRRFTRTSREQPGTRPEPVTAVQVAYTGDPSDLLAAAQDLSTQLRCRSFSEEVLVKAAAGRSAKNSHAGSGKSISAPPKKAGEKAVDLAFEIASYMALRDTGPESWGRKAATVATSGRSEGVKAVVKTVNYLLGPSALTVINDLTKLAGDAVKNINAESLRQSVARVDTELQVLCETAKAISHERSLHQPPSGAPASPSAARSACPIGRQSVSPPSEHRVPDPPSSRSSDRKHRPPSSPGAPGFR